MLGAGLILFLAVLQGATELFPVSSLGHAVVVPPLLHINFRESNPAFVQVRTAWLSIRWTPRNGRTLEEYLTVA